MTNESSYSIIHFSTRKFFFFYLRKFQTRKWKRLFSSIPCRQYPKDIKQITSNNLSDLKNKCAPINQLFFHYIFFFSRHSQIELGRFLLFSREPDYFIVYYLQLVTSIIMNFFFFVGDCCILIVETFVHELLTVPT